MALKYNLELGDFTPFNFIQVAASNLDINWYLFAGGITRALYLCNIVIADESLNLAFLLRTAANDAWKLPQTARQAPDKTVQFNATVGPENNRVAGIVLIRIVYSRTEGDRIAIFSDTPAIQQALLSGGIRPEFLTTGRHQEPVQYRPIDLNTVYNDAFGKSGRGMPTWAWVLISIIIIVVVGGLLLLLLKSSGG
jgi:hypothetical protein